MFQLDNKNEIQFRNCLKVALEVMKSKIIASDNSCVGVVFYGTVSICLRHYV